METRHSHNSPARNPAVRGGTVILAKGLACSLLVGFFAAGLPCAAQAQVISYNYRPQTLFGNQTTGARNTFQIYDTANGWGVTFLEPTTLGNPLNYSTSAGTGQLYYNFFNTVNRLYPTTSGWNVTGNTAAFAPGSLQVGTYGAIGTPAEVGADFTVNYLTTKPGPTPGTTVSNGNPNSNIHWIQVVSTNNAITSNGATPPVLASNPGTLANRVDVRWTNTTSPYYDGGGPLGPGYTANSTVFDDSPRRPDVEFDNSWIASLFLVSGPTAAGTAMNPNTITVYNRSGITWGWQNFFFQNVNEQQFVDDVEQYVFADDQFGEFNVELDLGTGNTPVTVDLVPTTDYASYEQEFLGAVPEPSSWAMLALGFAGLGYVGFRRRQTIAIV